MVLSRVSNQDCARQEHAVRGQELGLSVLQRLELAWVVLRPLPLQRPVGVLLGGAQQVSEVACISQPMAAHGKNQRRSLVINPLELLTPAATALTIGKEEGLGPAGRRPR